MTTPLVQSISDEQLAELEKIVCYREPSFINQKIVNGTIAGLIARLRNAEARYEWLIRQDRVKDVLDQMLEAHSWTVDAYGPLIDARIEQTP